jgi:hypothetical protein
MTITILKKKITITVKVTSTAASDKALDEITAIDETKQQNDIDEIFGNADLMAKVRNAQARKLQRRAA